MKRRSPETIHQPTENARFLVFSGKFGCPSGPVSADLPSRRAANDRTSQPGDATSNVPGSTEMRNDIPGRAALFCAALAAAASSAQAAPPPHIANVTFTQTGQTWSATVSGLHFGPTPGGIPCNNCAPMQMQVYNLASLPAQQSINVTGWSDTSITLTGIAAAPGDAMQVAVYNATQGNAAAWGGHVSHASHVPHIASIVAVPHGRKTIFTINGSGFGPAPPQVGQDTTSPFLILTDFNNHEQNGFGFPWSGGFCNANDCNQVTVNYTSWNDSQVVISGYGAARYGGGGGDWTIHPHDAFCVGIWSSNNQGDGTTGGTTKCIRLPK